MRVFNSAFLVFSFASVRGFGSDTVSPCSDKGSGTMRNQMLQRFRSHFDDKEKGYFERPHSREPGQQLVMMSKEDYYCDGKPLPTFYIEYFVPDVRPVDVFNILADTLSQPKWLCSGCTISLIKNSVEEQVQGFSATYDSSPMNRREFYQWQAYDANFSTEEFLVGTAARHNEELHKLKAPESDATVGRMCFSFSRIRKADGGAHVVQMSHFDARVPSYLSFGPFSFRNVYHTVWPMMLRRVPKIFEGAKKQAQKNWEDDRISVADVFLGAENADESNLTAAQIDAQFRVGTPEVATSGGATTGGTTLESKPWLLAVIIASAVFCVCCLCGTCAYRNYSTLQEGIWCCLDADYEEESEEEYEEETNEEEAE